MHSESSTIGPRDHAEEVAIFRAQVIGPLLARNLTRGEVAEGLRALAAQKFRPPGSLVERSFALSTLEKWLYAHRRYGLEGLVPVPRSDRGAAQKLSDAQRDLLCEIREQYPRASAELILRTLEADGRLECGIISPGTLRRLFLERGLDRKARAHRGKGGIRRRWEAAEVDDVWHSDVCHGPALVVGEHHLPLRIHAILDDKSRYIVALVAAHSEREQEMLALLVAALRRRGKVPGTLYLDNGSTYSGKTLETVCARLGVRLVHAKPYDPEARGKMERFWRTLREGCLDHLGPMSTLHDVQIRMLAFLDTHYHIRGHASLMGKSPSEVYGIVPPDAATITEAKLADALTVRGRRRVRRDGTVEIGGTAFETNAGFLAGRNVIVARSLLDPSSAPWVEHDTKRFALAPVDPVKNGRRGRHERDSGHRPRVGLDLDFDPPTVALDRWLGRRKKESAT